MTTTPAHTLLGNYEVLRHLASGGMADIYLARVRGLEGFERLVVLKQVQPRLADDPELVEMFLEEARLAATLNHVNIAQVFDVGVEEGRYFFAMEFLQGANVARILKTTRAAGTRVPLEHALEIGRGVCSGLHYAHERRGPDGVPLNVVHRDVSPENVFVTYDGGVKLLDFGIARAASRASHTAVGLVRGKASYMSPEQSLGEPLDRRSDIFSLCIVLWELTTGRRLFTGRDPFEVRESIISREPLRPSRVVPDYPAELERIVMRGLSRARAERYQTAEELQRDLERFAQEHDVPVSAVRFERYLKQLFADEVAAMLAGGQREEETFARSFSANLISSSLEEAPPPDEQLLGTADLAPPRDEELHETADLAGPASVAAARPVLVTAALADTAAVTTPVPPAVVPRTDTAAVTTPVRPAVVPRTDTAAVTTPVEPEAAPPGRAGPWLVAHGRWFVVAAALAVAAGAIVVLTDGLRCDSAPVELPAAAPAVAARADAAPLVAAATQPAAAPPPRPAAAPQPRPASAPQPRPVAATVEPRPIPARPRPPDPPAVKRPGKGRVRPARKPARPKVTPRPPQPSPGDLDKAFP